MRGSSRIIFLDIDGVMVTLRSIKQPRIEIDVPVNGNTVSVHRFDQLAVASLNQILDSTGAKIVISSTWRGNGKTESLPWLQRVLDLNQVRGKVIGATPRLERMTNGVWIAPQRGDEIQAWLDEHPEVSSFVILDDDSDMGALKPWLIKTDFEQGLTPQHARRAITMLSRSSTLLVSGQAADPAH